MKWLFGLFTKIIKRSGTSFCCTFSAWLSYKNVLYLILHLWTKFQFHIFFPSQDIKQNVLEFLFRQLMTSWTLRFIFNHPLKQWPIGRKRGKARNKKIWISQEQKEHFGWNKKHFFIVFEGYHLVKKWKFDENSGHKL